MIQNCKDGLDQMVSKLRVCREETPWRRPQTSQTCVLDVLVPKLVWISQAAKRVSQDVQSSNSGPNIYCKNY